jgi:6-phosphogluconolactonase
VTGPEVRRLDTPEDLAEAAATELVELLVRAQADGRVPSMVLTGGTIAGKIHERVAGSPAGGQVDWSRVDVWFGDERFVPAGDPDRNDGQARRALLDRLPFDPARVHAMPTSDGDHPDLADAATAYGDELRSQGGGTFDVVMLGVGPDGHVASLFPGHPQLDVDDAVAVGVTRSPKPPPERISLSFAALNRSREVWFFVSGDEKAGAVAQALADGTDVHDVPAVGVRGQQRTVWFLDGAAASRL